MCLSGASRVSWPAWTWPKLVWHPAMLPRRARWRARRSSADDTIQSVADQARANFILARAAMMTGPSRRGDRRLPEDDCDQQGTTAAGLVAHLSGPHARPGMQARGGSGGIQGGARRTRRAQDTRLAAERGVKTAYEVRGHSCDAEDDSDGSAPDKPGPDMPGPDKARPDKPGSDKPAPGATRQQASPPKPQ